MTMDQSKQQALIGYNGTKLKYFDHEVNIKNNFFSLDRNRDVISKYFH